MIDGKGPGILQTAFLYHDNAPSHRAAHIKETIKRLVFELLDHPLLTRLDPLCFIYPRYEVYRGYIVFAFSVIMIVCLFVCPFVCLYVNFFSVNDFSATA